LKSIFRELKDALARKDLSLERVELLQEIQDYISSGSWTQNRKFAKKVSIALQHGNSKAADSLGISTSGVRLLLARASQVIRNVIGSNLIHLIADGSEEEFLAAEFQFFLVKCNVNPSMYFQPGVFPLIPNTHSRAYCFDELTAEISFLRKQTFREIQKELEVLNEDKLAFLVSELFSVPSELTTLKVKLFNQFFQNN
jgi:hypothetical protein